MVSRRSELNRSSQVAAALRNASCRRISCSTSSTLPPSSLLLINGSWAVSHASATTASWANWWTSNTEQKRGETGANVQRQTRKWSILSWILYVFIYVFIIFGLCMCVYSHCCRNSQCLSHFSDSSYCLATTLSSFSLIWESKSARSEIQNHRGQNQY